MRRSLCWLTSGCVPSGISRRLATRSTSSGRRSASASVSRHTALDEGDRQIGDYPTDIPMVSAQLRSLQQNRYWDLQDRRNPEEPLHEQDEVLQVWSLDEDTSITPQKALLQLALAFSVLGGIYGLSRRYNAPEKIPVTPRQVLENPYSNVERRPM